ncbi:MAG: alpha/beta hydrolase fold domain-containing protein [Prolixibacteraceae bacterium]|nr:alpha/beta hydrolase fold domain-containing protein [Prolixibacteraceae bacterium]
MKRIIVLILLLNSLFYCTVYSQNSAQNTFNKSSQLEEDNEKVEVSESFTNKILKAAMRLSGVKKNMNLQRMYTKQLRSKPAVPPKKIYKKYKVSKELVDGRNVWKIEPKKNGTKQYILYFHGGAYVLNFESIHWSYLSKLIDALNCTIIAPDYPLTPENSVSQVFDFIFPLYKRIEAKVGAKNISLMGDSAGGGICFALAQKIRNENLEQPKRIYLLCPWLNANLNNEEIVKIDKHDPILNVSGLQEIGEAYAGMLGTNHYLVSPGIGNVRNLAPVTLFVGTHEILYPDCKLLVTKMQEEEGVINYFEYPFQFHTFMFFPIAESEDVLQKIRADF